MAALRPGMLSHVLARSLHLLGPAVVAVWMGWSAGWTLLQMLALAWALVLLLHTILRWLDSEAFTMLSNPLAGVAVLISFGLLVWLSFFVTGLVGPQVDLSLAGPAGAQREVRVVSLMIVLVPAFPYGLVTLADLLGLRDD